MKKPQPSGTRQEIERIVADLKEKVLVSPGKAAKVLANWIDQAPGGSKKKPSKAEKKPAA
jgi:hypothetical protein